MGKQRTILVMEEAGSLQSRVREMLIPAGFAVVEAADRDDVLEKLAEGEFSLVVVDLRMPSRTGLDVVRAITGSQAPERSVPVVIVSNEGQPHLMQRAQQAGVRAWLVKPFDPSLFIAAVDGYCPPGA